MDASTSDTLLSGKTLTRGQQITSKDGKCVAIMQNDGNFVLYRKHKALWASNTVG